MSKLDQIISSKMDENGVQNITLGNVAARQMARMAVELLKAEGGKPYAEYKAIKFNTEPGEKGFATPESKKAAYVFALKAAAELAGSLYDQSIFEESGD